MKTLTFNDNAGTSINYLTDLIDGNEQFTILQISCCINGVEKIGLTDELIRVGADMIQIGKYYMIEDFIRYANLSGYNLLSSSEESNDPIYLVDNRAPNFEIDSVVIDASSYEQGVTIVGTITVKNTGVSGTGTVEYQIVNEAGVVRYSGTVSSEILGKNESADLIVSILHNSETITEDENCSLQARLVDEREWIISSIFLLSRNWTPLTLVVEDATPTYVAITFPSAKTVIASDFTIAGFIISSGSWTGSVYTLVLTFAVISTDNLVVVYKGKSYSVTNNVFVAAPTLLIATAITDVRIDLTWTGLATSIERSTDGLTFTEFAVIAAGNSYSNIGLTAGNRYYYRVRNLVGANYSAYSNIIHDTTILRQDLFTGTNGTHLHDHTPDIGGAAVYTSPTNMTISGNKLVSTGALAYYNGVFETSKTDIDLTVDMTIPDVNDYQSGIILRYQDATHYILIDLYRIAGAAPVLRIGYRNGGGPTLIKDQAITHEAITSQLRAVASGNDIFVFWKDMVNPIVTGVTAQYNTKTVHGLMMVGNTGTISVVFDNLLVTPFRVPVVKQAGISLAFDDPWFPSGTTNLDSWITAHATLSQYGWKASFAVPTTPTNTTADQDLADLNLWKNRLNTLVAAGHVIVNHTFRHLAYGTFITGGGTKQQYYDNYIVPLQTLFQTVFGYVPIVYRYSNWYGESDCVESNLMYAGGFQIVEDNTAVYPADPSTITFKGWKNPTSFDIAPYTGDTFSDAQILALLDYARDNRQIINIFSHTIIFSGSPGNYQVHIDRLTTICQYIVNNNMKFYTENELNANVFV